MKKVAESTETSGSLNSFHLVSRHFLLMCLQRTTNLNCLVLLILLDWMPVDYMLQYKDAVMTFKCLNDLAPSYLARRFISRSQTHDRDTRCKGELQIPFYRTATGQRSFIYRATKLWNELEDDIKNISNIETFKILIRKKLYKECWNSCMNS